jgi:putative ABC transport system permease protein
MLLQHPTVTVISLLTLGLGIGASTAVFSVVDATLLSPPPFEEPDRIVRLFASKPAAGWDRMTISAPNFIDWSEQSSSFEATGIFGAGAVNVTGEEHPDRLRAILASSGVLQVLRIAPTLGRTADASYDHPDAKHVVLLSDRVWRERFAARTDVVGSVLRIDDVPHEVIGVLPPETEAAVRAFDLWLPFTYGEVAEVRGNRHYGGFARLRDGVSVADADRELKTIAEDLAEAYPDSNRGHTAAVVPLTEVLLGARSRSVLYILCAAVGSVLLIACVNIANLLLTTAGSREREFAVRTALGAGPTRLLRQLMIESGLLAVGGGLIGIIVAYWSVDILTASLQTSVRFLGEPGVDGKALAFTLVVLGMTSLGFGLPVALRASRSRFADLIRTNARTVLGTRRERLRRDILVIGQVGLALALMISAVLMIRSLTALKAVDPGFETERLLTMRVSLPGERYPSGAEQYGFFQDGVDEIASLPGVQSVSATSMLPLLGSNSNSGMSLEDHPISDPADTIFVGNEAVMPGYLRTIGIPLLEGRDFTAFDRADTPPVILINHFMARHFWPDESAIGKRVKFGQPDSTFPWMEVVGVMGDHRQTSLDTEPRFEILYPQAQFPSPTMTFVVRTHADPASSVSAVQEAIWQAGPDLAIYEIDTMEAIVAANTRSLDSLTNLLSGFGLIALVLALGGLYGVMSFTVGRRTQEIGVRMALGAEARSILRAVLQRSAALILFGVLAGGLIARLLSLWLNGILFEVSAFDPAAYIAVAAGMLAVGLLATLFPALRAARIDPVIALRNE